MNISMITQVNTKVLTSGLVTTLVVRLNINSIPDNCEWKSNVIKSDFFL